MAITESSQPVPVPTPSLPAKVALITEPPQSVTEPPQPVINPPQPIPVPTASLHGKVALVTESPQPVTESPQPVTESLQPVIDPPQPIPVPTASLHGKVALITGAGRGIGRGCALELGKRGASVIVNYVSSKGPAEEVCQLISSFNNGARAIAIQADVSKISEIDRLFQEARTAFGKIDIVMSNSGAESWDKTEEITEEKFDHIFNLNSRAQFFVGQAAWKYVEDHGRVILMTSIAAGLLGVKDHALYNGSKMAVIGFVKAFATDFGARGITVNGVAPGGIKSDMFVKNAWHYIPGGTPEWPAEKIEGLMAQHCPLGRCATPEDVARVVAFLASEDGGWVNGQVITISGGSSQ